MRIAFITPYYRETPDQLMRCIDSVKSQTVNAVHFMIADGHPQEFVKDLGVRHIALDRRCSDHGNTPRAVGSLHAINEGVDVLGFLDADNWIDKNHLAICLETVAKASRKADLVVSRRRWVRDDKSELSYESQEDSDYSHVDTNCILLLPGAIHTAARWGFIPKPVSMIGDRIFYRSLLSEGFTPIFTNKITVNYLCTWSNVYKQMGEDVPSYAKENIDLSDALVWWRRLDAVERAYIKRRLGFELFPAASV